MTGSNSALKTVFYCGINNIHIQKREHKQSPFPNDECDPCSGVIYGKYKRLFTSLFPEKFKV